MKPSEVRARILADHVALRAQLDALEKRARKLLGDEGSQVGELRVRGEALLQALLQHMRWEDVYLAPALRAADAWGEQRAARLDHEHREQRELLAHVLESLQDQSRPAAVLARQLVDLVRLLREDMESEEAAMLDPRVLRDDVVGIDVLTG